MIKPKIILIIFITLLIALLAFSFVKYKISYNKDYSRELRGKITNIKNSGKGSYCLTIIVNGINEDFYLLGLGENENDISINDSVWKSAYNDVYFFYRKINGEYKLIYKRKI